jgi:plasmid stabilization system protein ParE
MPQNRWTNQDERQYDHIKESELDRGRNPALAAEIAARTVNKHRREEGRTRNRRTSGTGNPRLPLAERARDELYNMAAEAGVRGRSRMSKAKLIESLQSASGSQARKRS